MHDNIARTRLAAVPASVRNAMLAQRQKLPAGAIASVARFFAVLDARQEHMSAPTRATFEEACQSEATLALLLRVLQKHAPAVCLSEGRELRKAYYRRRAGGSEHPDRIAPLRAPSRTVPRNWPPGWLALLPGLQSAPIKDSSIDRHVASVNRCAAMLANVRCPPRLGWLLAWELAQEIQRNDVDVTLTEEEKSKRKKKDRNDRTTVCYIGGLISLGLHGGLDKAALDGMRAVQTHYQRKMRRLPKQKEARINALYEKGGYDEIMRAILHKLEEADALADWTAEAAVARATAAILAVCVNDPARTGDVALWNLGEALTREPWGSWHLCWQQEKTGVWKPVGELWPEICHVLDEHILGGRPKRHAQRRFEELRGLNWLTFTDQAYASRWPSEQVCKAIGVPLHDLRTLIADYLRMHDPVSAPNIISVILGHRSLEAGKGYRALCAETAAQRELRKIRKVHAAGHFKRRARPMRSS